MLLRQIALISKSKKVTHQELSRVSAALQRQVSKDLRPIWQIDATVDAFPSDADVPLGYWKITVMDKIPATGASGFHLDKQGQPFADVAWSDTWSLSASHECLEMLVDPFGRQIMPGPSPKEGQGRVNFLVEVCDPVESPANAYTINTGTTAEVQVSDFYTPEFFSPVRSAGARYSFGGNLRSPRQVLKGGYLSWFDPADGHIWQLFGPAEMGNFQDQGAGSLSRDITDHFARRTRAAHAAKSEKMPAGRKLRLMADGGQCNLTSDPFTSLLSGPAGAQTTVQIKDSTGNAIFQSISYGGSQIGSNTASASFSIKKGNADLSYVPAAPVPGDALKLTDPCGNILDSFFNDGLNVRDLQVAGK